MNSKNGRQGGRAGHDSFFFSGFLKCLDPVFVGLAERCLEERTRPLAFGMVQDRWI
ncbi:MAG: hypothetical protein OXC91_07915 [Rhodobacteraceae bacterium]|nr:hypothetical protein [Paracoccaceae bacterium]